LPSVAVSGTRTVTVKKGTEKLDLSGLTANLVWASGKTEKADLSKAEIVGYDKDAAGESEVTVKVTVDGKTYQAQLTVRVQRGGCGSVAEAGASVFAGAVIALSARRSSSDSVKRRKSKDIPRRRFPPPQKNEYSPAGAGKMIETE